MNEQWCRCSGVEHVYQPSCYLPGRAPESPEPPQIAVPDLEERLDEAYEEGRSDAEFCDKDHCPDDCDMSACHDDCAAPEELDRLRAEVKELRNAGEVLYESVADAADNGTDDWGLIEDARRAWRAAR